MRKLELLAPARDAVIAIQAIMHGADAVYMGPPKFGARAVASNSIDDFKRVAELAHVYRAKVYATVNTILYDSELLQVERMIAELYNAGVDAIIVQDMGILRLDIPPIELHASTQCDIRTIEKAQFLERVGFSQLVLARELNLKEIQKISESVNIPIEGFVHGALCVSYSGRCHASAVCKGRSANRGECAQMCRLPYTLIDGKGHILAKNKHLLSLRDFNASATVAQLAAAGVSSFKIEGRLKDVSYVKNITSFYRQLLDDVISENPDKYIRSSFGISDIDFIPRPEKSFNRGFTDYFLNYRRPATIASLDTPKSLGEVISDNMQLNNGDGIAFFNSEGEYVGVNVNRVEQGRIIPSRPINIPYKVCIHRTNDIKFEQELSKSAGRRTIGFDVSIDNKGVSAKDERGMYIRIPLNVKTDVAAKPFDPTRFFAKTGNTVYRLKSCDYQLGSSVFIPASDITRLKNNVLIALDMAAEATYHRGLRRKEDVSVVYPDKAVDFRENVSNKLALDFYKSHGVEVKEMAIETLKRSESKKSGRVVMTCRHCILREIGKCKKDNLWANLAEPLTIRSSEGDTFRLDFDCASCTMRLIIL